MPNISEVKGNVGLYKEGYKKFLSLGEGVSSDEFVMTIEGYENLRWLIQTTQIPPMVRENIESYGPHGVQFNQQGRFKNAQDVPFSVREVVSGEAYKALREIVKEKKYVKITLGLTGESMPTSNEDLTWVLEDCWIELEGVDLSVEDGATLIKPTGTIHANWISHFDDDVAGANVSMGTGGQA